MVTPRTRKAAPKAAPALPFNVPAPVEKALEDARTRFETLQTETQKVAAKVERKVKTAAAQARKTGQEIAKDPKAFVDGVVQDSKKLGKNLEKNVSRAKVDATKQVKAFADQVTKKVSTTVETAVEKTLHRFNVPTRQELKTLVAKVDGLSKKIDSLSGSRRRAAK